LITQGGVAAQNSRLQDVASQQDQVSQPTLDDVNDGNYGVVDDSLHFQTNFSFGLTMLQSTPPLQVSQQYGADCGYSALSYDFSGGNGGGQNVQVFQPAVQSNVPRLYNAFLRPANHRGYFIDVASGRQILPTPIPI
jgi:hypothetical protein